MDKQNYHYRLSDEQIEEILKKLDKELFRQKVIGRDKLRYKNIYFK
ncbi:hypothetical protein LCGC14_0694300 [marine sediment metagenome]|uniref:Uncharacterized protein n=1 Tax=marine sediment metagenome TaxID=412755 RepID=A0A0F9TSI5_9ZZZZ